MFLLHVFYHIISEGGENNGGVKGEKAAKPVITVQDNKIYIYIFLISTSLCHIQS